MRRFTRKIGYDCFVHAGAVVKKSILFSGCDIGAKARINRVILDKNCSIAPGVVIGEDPEADAERFPFITPSGIVVLPKGSHVPKKGPVEFTQDMDFLMQKDPAVSPIINSFKGGYAICKDNRHSHDSAGPRYKRFGPGALSGGAQPRKE